MENKQKPGEVLHGQSILSISLERWSYVWRSRHHIMSALANDNQVLFASSPAHIRDVFSNLKSTTSDKTGIARITSNLYTYIPPLWLPIFFRYPKLEQVIRKLRAWHIRRVMRELGMKQPLLYIWHPAFADIVKNFDDAFVIYHCYDEYSSFEKNSSTHTLLETQERNLLKRADIVFAVSDKVRERRLAFNPNIHVVSNGVDYPLFSKAQEATTEIPLDMQTIQRPIIGLVTTLTSITDIGLLSQIFQYRTDWSFVFIGLQATPEHLMSHELREFLRLPNVHVIGRRALQDIPGYLKGCDLCTIPWVLNELSLSGFPLKLYEYLAAGKPVVSTPLNHLFPLSNVIKFASNANEWISAIESVLLGGGPGTIAERQSIAKDNAWVHKVEFISSKVQEEMNKRNHA